MRVCTGCRATYPDSVSTCANDDLPLIGRAEGVEPAVGVQLGGYQLGAVLAEGTLGTIYAGIHPLFRKRAAIKVLNQRVVHDTRTLTAFVKEVYTVNEIGHPAIVDVYAVGALDDGRCFVVMDLVEGTSLRQLQQQKQRLQPGVALPIFEQLCQTVGTVHQAGCLHLGLNPERVLVLRCPPYPTIRLLGFGFDRLTGKTSVDIHEPTMMSAPVYTAPEQQPGGTVDARADVYSIGALLYELLVGQQPSLYPAEADRAEGLAAVGETLRQVVLKALAMEPEGRFASTEELLVALRSVLGDPLPWNVDVEARPGGETYVTGPPTAPSVGLFAPEAIEGEISADEISARAARTFRNVEGDVEYTESADTKEVPAPDVPSAPVDPLTPGSALGELNMAEIDDIDKVEEQAGVHVITEVTPPRGDGDVDETIDVGERPELDYSTDVRRKVVDVEVVTASKLESTDSSFELITAGGSDDLDVTTDLQEAATPVESVEEYLADDVTPPVERIEEYLADDVIPPVDAPPVVEESVVEDLETTGLYAPPPKGPRNDRSTPNEVVVSGLVDGGADDAYQEPDVTVPFDKSSSTAASRDLPSLSDLAAHVDEEDAFVEPDLTRPYGPEVEEVLAQEKQPEASRPRYPSIGPLAPEPLESAAPDSDDEKEEKKRGDAYLSIELVDGADDEG